MTNSHIDGGTCMCKVSDQDPGHREACADKAGDAHSRASSVAG